MQMILIGAAMLIGCAVAFFAFMAAGRWALAKWDAHEILSHSRKVEREAALREVAMQRYSMTNVRPARKS